MEKGSTPELKDLSAKVIWKIKRISDFYPRSENKFSLESPEFSLDPSGTELLCKLCAVDRYEEGICLTVFFVPSSPCSTFQRFFCRIKLFVDNHQDLITTKPITIDSSTENETSVLLGYLEKPLESMNELTVSCELWRRKPETSPFANVPIRQILLHTIGCKTRKGCLIANYDGNIIDFDFSYDKDKVKVTISGTLRNTCEVLIRGEGKVRQFRPLLETFYLPSVLFEGILTPEEDKRELTKFLKNDSLEFRCDTRLIFGEEIISSEQSFEQNSKADKNFLKRDVIQLYRDGLLTDFHVKAGTEVFSVHSVILAARSPYFRRKLDSDTTEERDRTLDVGDLSVSATCQMLEYLYSDDPGNLTVRVALELYNASVTYELKELKDMVSFFLQQNVSSNYVFEILTLAHRYEDEQLKSAVVYFIFEHAIEVLLSNEFKEFSIENPSLGEELRTEIKKLKPK